MEAQKSLLVLISGFWDLLVYIPFYGQGITTMFCGRPNKG